MALKTTGCRDWEDTGQLQFEAMVALLDPRHVRPLGPSPEAGKATAAHKIAKSAMASLQA